MAWKTHRVMFLLFRTTDLMTVVSKYDDAMEYHAQCLETQESVFVEKNDAITSTLYAMGLGLIRQVSCHVS